MAHFYRHLIALLACLLGKDFACRQKQPFPKANTKRYLVVATSFGQIFSFSDMVQRADATFFAKLTWWTAETACTVRFVSICGRITPTSIAFDARTIRNLGFNAELDRQEKGWVGKGSISSGLILGLESKAG